MNNVQIVGRLGGAPDLRALQTGEPIATFRIAVSFGSGDKERTDWFDVVSFGRQAETAGRILVKGQRIGVTGYLRNNTWKDETGSHSRVEIVAGNIEFYDVPRGIGEPAHDAAVAVPETKELPRRPGCRFDEHAEGRALKSKN